MSSSALQISPPAIDIEALRSALANIPGIVEVRIIRGTVWVVRDVVDVDRDCRLAGALAESLPPEVEFHTTTVSRMGMVPDGPRAL